MKNVVYYGLTEREVREKKVNYEKLSDVFTGKLIHLSEESLIEFLIDNDMHDTIRHYTIIPLSEFKEVKSIIHNEDYDTTVVEIPFLFTFNNVCTINYDKLK